MRRFLRWLASLGERQPAAGLEFQLFPYETPVAYGDYLAAWDQLRNDTYGKLIVQALHDNLVAELKSRCPQDIYTNEGRSLWLAGHDARLAVFTDLAKQAVLGTRLQHRPQAQRPPKLKG